MSSQEVQLEAYIKRKKAKKKDVGA